MFQEGMTYRVIDHAGNVVLSFHLDSDDYAPAGGGMRATVRRFGSTTRITLKAASTLPAIKSVRVRAGLYTLDNGAGVMRKTLRGWVGEYGGQRTGYFAMKRDAMAAIREMRVAIAQAAE